MITRVRFEATAKTEDAVRDDMASAVSIVQESLGGQWGYDVNGEQVQTTRDGYWGFAVIERRE